ncbi:hypothetical protein, partial [Pseudomonas sp.]|uniref:hypothetical protein n=1 Tax=Pseudomonas sp. TaxID=306 RepID=UPI003CC5D76A
SAQLSIGVAQQLGSRWTASADYVRYRVHHNWIKYDQNEVFNPATGYPQTTGTATTSANPAFTTITRYDTPQWISAYYDGLLVSVRRAYTNGFTLAASYTLARLKDNGESFSYALNNQFNAKDEWGPGVGDQRNTFNINGLYQMRWGFQAGGLLHFGSGAATYVAAGSSPFYNSPYSNRTYLATVKTYNNPKLDYASSAPGYNLVARDSLYGQPVYRLDIQLQKTFSFAHSRYRLIPIAQMFNTTNHPNYGSYNNDITQSSYGSPAASTDLAYAPREGQLAIRFEF